MYTKSVEDAVAYIKQELGNDWVVAAPLGLGKPNQLLNAIYRYAKEHPSINLTLLTALSLDCPKPSDALESKLAGPIIDRLFGDYCELDYLHDLKQNNIPENITLHEFYVKAGSIKRNAYAQQHYISSNYTHIPRDVMNRGVNVLVQLVAEDETSGEISLSCNTDVTLDLLPLIERSERKILKLAQVHSDLPFMPNRAVVPPETFDCIVKNHLYDTKLFSTPNQSVPLREFAIGLHASRLIRDGGTLQIGIGALGDAICHSLILRHQRNSDYRAILKSLSPNQSLNEDKDGAEIAPFNQGLYGCSEMFVNGFLHLMRAGILTREVDGIVMHAAFFLGPTDFYQALRTLPKELLNKIGMESVGFVNALGSNTVERTEQRRDARFINTGLMVTLSGAVASDGLEEGTVISGVGGQYNFVSMAHELEGARSVICVRATREQNGELKSNIVPHYGHCTIPRHLRDIVITEYGVADLRSKSDSEIVKALINIADSRFQESLLDYAKRHNKVEDSYVIPKQYRNNREEAINRALTPFRNDQLLPLYPLGSDYTDQEVALIESLHAIKETSHHPLQMFKSLFTALWHSMDEEGARPYLERLGLMHPDTPKERIIHQLLMLELEHRGYLRPM